MLMVLVFLALLLVPLLLGFALGWLGTRRRGWSLVAAGLTCWAAQRWPWLAVPVLPVFFVVFFAVVLPQIYGDGHGPFDDLLAAQLGGDVNRDLFLSCVLGAPLLLGHAGERKFSTLGR